jgi:hypothetical protein
MDIVINVNYPSIFSSLFVLCNRVREKVDCLCINWEKHFYSQSLEEKGGRKSNK